MTTSNLLSLTVLLISLAISWAQYTPAVPDSSPECLSCQAQVAEMDIVWTNVTTVEQILKELDAKCMAKYPITAIKQRKICEALAAVFVQIPPGLFKGMDDLAWPIPEAFCATIFKCHVNCCGDNNPPEQVHLSLPGSDASLMGVTWVSLNQTGSVVEYGLSESSLTAHRDGTIGTYRAAGWIGTIHRAVMSGLAPGTAYFYRVGDGKSNWSPVYSFTTLLPQQEMTYAVIADMDFEQDVNMGNLNDLVDEGRVQCIIHAGDESYADGYEPHWDVFFRRMERTIARVPYMAAPGNHEFWYNFTSYKHRFFLPGVMDEGGSGDNMFYSWNAGLTHFVGGNSETAVDTPNFSDRFLSWLKTDLAAVDRVKYPFVVVYFHRPMYCSNDGACEEGANWLTQQAEQIFMDHKVTVTIAGHVHAYERTYPMYQKTATQYDFKSPAAPVYIMQGASGNREGNKGPYSNLPAWSAANNQAVGFGLMTIKQNSLKWQFYAARSKEQGGPILKDEFELTL